MLPHVINQLDVYWQVARGLNEDTTFNFKNMVYWLNHCSTNGDKPL